MASSSRPDADTAYERALAAYDEKSYDVARRWSLEALAHDRQHAGARALLARLDAARRPVDPLARTATGPEVVSVDPTVLISRASRTASEPIEPTVMVQRDDPRRRLGDTDAHEVIRPPKHTPPRHAAEPTAIIQPKKRTPSSRSQASHGSLAAVGQSIRAWFQRSGAAPRTAADDRSSRDRRSGVLIALATVTVGALLLAGGYLLVRAMWPAGQLLTITKPEGGTIVGPGLECGTRGSDCSTTVATGETVQLEVQPDKDFVFSGYTGDCAPVGRTFMNEPRTCGATFNPVGGPVGPVTFTLTILKPDGGTIVGPGGVLCGALGDTCTAEVPSGQPLTLKAEAADGFTWQQFTGDCPSTGETTMTAAKTCGAVFIRTSGGPVANRGPDRIPPDPGPRTLRQGGRRTEPSKPPQPPQATGQQNPSTPQTGGTETPVPTGLPQTPTTPTDKPVAAPQSKEDHAKEEIQQLLKDYCNAYESLQPARIQKVFPLVNQAVLKEQFRQYKSLQCTLTSPPEYDRLDASAAGGAQLKVGIKQVRVMRSGGAPETTEMIVTMVVSRPDFQTPWLIDRATHELKPK